LAVDPAAVDKTRAVGRRRGVVRVASRVLFGLATVIFAIVLFNWSGFAGPHRTGPPLLIAHRGVHQTFSAEGIDNATCTAARIFPPTHAFIENTLPSMGAAFAAGADVVELDVHLTRDQDFAVMHDWTLECRTNGAGVTEEARMADLKALDVGFGYTADGGRTFPLRGHGVGLMPTLAEVLDAFPDGRFLVNFKSRRTEEGDALADLLAQNPDWRAKVWGSYGGTEPTVQSWRRIERLKGYTRQSLAGCLRDYIATGWTGAVPRSCHDTVIVVPANLGWLLWGWPHRFTRRMERAGTDVVLLGPMDAGDVGSRGIDDLDELRLIPKGFGGYVWTNRIEVIGPALKARAAQ
jgi:glycerophosphoryl diester phosphodiesterase